MGTSAVSSGDAGPGECPAPPGCVWVVVYTSVFDDDAIANSVHRTMKGAIVTSARRLAGPHWAAVAEATGVPADAPHTDPEAALGAYFGAREEQRDADGTLRSVLFGESEELLSITLHDILG